MLNGGSSGDGYEVHYSGAVKDAILHLQRQATRRGQGNGFLSAFRRIVRAIQDDANNVGEPVYRLPALRLLVRTCIVGPLVVDFAVHEDRPLEFLKGVQLLSQ